MDKIEQALERMQTVQVAWESACGMADCGSCKRDREALATLRAELAAMKAALEQWPDAYAAFKGAFDTPAEWRRRDDEFANDARRRLRDINDALDRAREVGNDG